MESQALRSALLRPNAASVEAMPDAVDDFVTSAERAAKYSSEPDDDFLFADEDARRDAYPRIFHALSALTYCFYERTPTEFESDRERFTERFFHKLINCQIAFPSSVEIEREPHAYYFERVSGPLYPIPLHDDFEERDIAGYGDFTRLYVGWPDAVKTSIERLFETILSLRTLFGMPTYHRVSWIPQRNELLRYFLGKWSDTAIGKAIAEFYPYAWCRAPQTIIELNGWEAEQAFGGYLGFYGTIDSSLGLPRKWLEIIADQASELREALAGVPNYDERSYGLAASTHIEAPDLTVSESDAPHNSTRESGRLAESKSTRKTAYERQRKADEDLRAEWRRASEAGSTKRQFCDDKAISVATLNAALKRLRANKSREKRRTEAGR